MSLLNQLLLGCLAFLLVCSTMPLTYSNAETEEVISIQYEPLSFHDIWNLNTSVYAQLHSHAFILNSKVVENYMNYKLFGIRFTAFLEHMNDTVDLIGNYGFGLLFRDPIHEFGKIGSLKDFVIPCIIENYTFKNPVYQKIHISGFVQDVDNNITNGFIPVMKSNKTLMNAYPWERVNPTSFSDWCAQNRSTIEKVNFQGNGSIVGITYSEIESISDLIPGYNPERVTEWIIDILVQMDSNFEVLKVLRDLPLFDVGCYLFIEEKTNSTRHIIPFIYVSFLEQSPSFLRTLKMFGTCSLFNISGWYLDLKFPEMVDTIIDCCVETLDTTTNKTDFVSGFLFGIQMDEKVPSSISSGGGWLVDDKPNDENILKLIQNNPGTSLLICIFLLIIIVGLIRKRR